MIRNVLIFVVVEKYLFVKIHLFTISEETCWKLLGFPKAFLDTFLRSPSFPGGTGVQAVIPGYVCIIDNLGTRHTFQHFFVTPWFWNPNSEG